MMKALFLILLAGKMGKLLMTGGTMLVSLVSYSFVYGWRYALGFVGLLFAHEMGHFLAAKQRGLDVGAPCFIPFVGAWVQLKEQPMDAEVEAFVGMGGPLLGTAAAFLCYLAAAGAESLLLKAVSYAGFMLNLFNLIPLSPLDGGRIVSVISPKIGYVGIPLLIVLFLWQPSPMLLVFGLLFIPKVIATLMNKELASSAYYTVASKRMRINYAIQYLLLVLFLSVAAFLVHEQIGAARSISS